MATTAKKTRRSTFRMARTETIRDPEWSLNALRAIRQEVKAIPSLVSAIDAAGIALKTAFQLSNEIGTVDAIVASIIADVQALEALVNAEQIARALRKMEILFRLSYVRERTFDANGLIPVPDTDFRPETLRT